MAADLAGVRRNVEQLAAQQDRMVAQQQQVVEQQEQLTQILPRCRHLSRRLGRRCHRHLHRGRLSHPCPAPHNHLLCTLRPRLPSRRPGGLCLWARSPVSREGADFTP